MDYVQELRTLLAAMQLDTLPEEVLVTIFMEGLRTRVARTEMFRVHPSTFEEAVDIELIAKFNFKATRYGTHGHAQPSFDRAEPMDLIRADDNEAELQAVEQQRNIRKFYTCTSTRHLHPYCSLHKPRQSRPSRNTTSNQKPGPVKKSMWLRSSRNTPE